MEEELKLLNSMVDLLPVGKTLRLDMNLTNRHWLLNYEYFYVPKNLSLERLNLSVHHGCNRLKGSTPFDYLEGEFARSIKHYWVNKLEIGSVKLLAWSKYTVEQDTGLCLIYDLKGDFKGIYCHCMNRVQEFIYVGQSLKAFFDLDATLADIMKAQPEDDVLALKLKLSKNQMLTYDKYLQKYEYKILDAELGSNINMALYKEMIDNTFIRLSRKELHYTNLEFISNNESLIFKWHIDGWSYDFNLDNSSDYIDERVYQDMNHILDHTGSKNRFVVFRDIDFGQEYGVAFLGKRKRQGLRKLFRVEVLNETE